MATLKCHAVRTGTHADGCTVSHHTLKCRSGTRILWAVLYHPLCKIQHPHGSCKPYVSFCMSTDSGFSNFAFLILSLFFGRWGVSSWE